MYEFDMDGIAREVVRRGARRVILQLPDGMRPHGFLLAKELEELTSAEVIISGNPCYGACDLALDDLVKFQADLIVHFGHSEIPPLTVQNVLYAESHVELDVVEPTIKAGMLLGAEESVGLAATVQHLSRLEDAKRALEGLGKKVYIGGPSGWLKHQGQVLGCDYNSVKAVADHVEAFVVIAGGNFHGIGVHLASGKRTIVADPYAREARDISDLAQKIVKKRYASITKFKDSKKVAIIVNTKSGQFNVRTALSLKEKLERAGKECIVIALAEVRPEYLMSFSDIEAFVNTACPRIATDDEDNFLKPMLNPNEVMVALGEVEFEKYLRSYAG